MFATDVADRRTSRTRSGDRYGLRARRDRRGARSRRLRLELLEPRLQLTVPYVHIDRPGGILDGAFGGDGIASTDFLVGVDEARSLAIQTGAGGDLVALVAAGYAADAGQMAFAVSRYLPDGNLDSSFDTDGKRTDAIGLAASIANSVAIQVDGSVVVGGEAVYNLTNDSYAFALARYTPLGDLDSSFNGDGDSDGIILTSIGEPVAGPPSVLPNDNCYAIAMQGDGKILAAGASLNTATMNNDFALVRYNADGSLDTADFGGGTGMVTTEVGPGNDAAYALAIQPDGKIVLLGSADNGTDSDVAVVRYEADGALDVSFGVGGKLLIDSGGQDYGTGVALQSDNKIVLVGHVEEAGVYHVAVARLLPDGTPEAMITAPMASWAGDVAVQPDGKVVVAGRTDTAMAVARLLPDGTFDPSFDDDGWLTTSIGGSAGANSVVIQPDGKIAVAGFGSESGGDSDFALARYAEGPVEVLEGSEYASAGLFNDPDAGDTWMATVDYGDESGTQPLGLAGQTFVLSHTYADDRSYPLWVTVNDGLNVGNDMVPVIVQNVAPIVPDGPDQGADVGDLITVDATFFDPGLGDTHMAWIDWDDGAGWEQVPPHLITFSAPDPGAGTVTGTHIYGRGGEYHVQVRVQDDDGGEGAGQIVVWVQGPGSIHGLGFEDLDADGQYQESMDALLAGMEVQLTGDVDGDGHQDVLTTTTDVNGEYQFLELAPGLYSVVELLPAGAIPTAPYPDSPPAPSAFVVYVNNGMELVAYPGQSGLDPQFEQYLGDEWPGCLMFGHTYPGSIHGFKFADVDANRVYDPSVDAAQGGVTFRLSGDVDGDYEPDTLEMVSAADGTFAFENLLPGYYQLAEVLPEGTLATTESVLWLQVFSRQESVALAGQAGLLPAAVAGDPRIDPFVSGPNMLPQVPLGVAIGPDGDLFVASSGDSSILRYAGTTGQFEEVFIDADVGIVGVTNPGLGLVFHGEHLYVSNTTIGQVRRFGAGTGVQDRSFELDLPALTGMATETRDLAFDAAGNLYVSVVNPIGVFKFNPDGSIDPAFDTSLSGSVDDPRGIAIGPGGRLYVAGAADDDCVVSFDLNGQGASVFVATGNGGLNDPQDLLFGPDFNGEDGTSDLYVASGGTNEVLVYDGATGEFLGAKVPETRLLGAPSGMAFDAGGILFVAGQTTNNVVRAVQGDRFEALAGPNLMFGNTTQFGRISGRKFNDLNGNGIDDGEPGIADWVIVVADAPPAPFRAVAATLTDADGNYSFENLIPGDYVVMELWRADWAETLPAWNPPALLSELGPGEYWLADFPSFQFNGTLEIYGLATIDWQEGGESQSFYDGEIQVTLGPPDADTGNVPAEILDFEMYGTTAGLQVVVRAGDNDPNSAEYLDSPGGFQQSADPSLVDSFFDLTFEVEPLGFPAVQGVDPVHLEATLDRMPVWGVPFRSTNAVELQDADGFAVGTLTELTFVIVDPTLPPPSAYRISLAGGDEWTDVDFGNVDEWVSTADGPWTMIVNPQEVAGGLPAGGHFWGNTIGVADDADLDRLTREWFWYRIGDTGPELPLDSLTFMGAESQNNWLVLTYGDPASSDPIQVTVEYQLQTDSENLTQSTLLKDVQIVNLGVAPIDMHWFQYTDLDVDGAFGPDQDTAEYPIDVGGTPMLRQTGGLGSVVHTPFVLDANSHWEIAPADEILTALDDGGSTTLGNINRLAGVRGNVTYAFQWDWSLDVAGNVSYQVGSQSNVSEVVLPNPDGTGRSGGGGDGGTGGGFNWGAPGAGGGDDGSNDMSGPFAPRARPFWYDPAIALGYDYVATVNRFASVTLPFGYGSEADNNTYWLYLSDGAGGYDDSPTATLQGGEVIDLTAYDPTGLAAFRILGIRTAPPEEGRIPVDPANAFGFPTGLTYVEGDVVFDATMTGIPETIYVDQYANFEETQDYGLLPGTVQVGDLVTWQPGTANAVAGLVFGVTAFDSLAAARARIAASDYAGLTQIHAEGEYGDAPAPYPTLLANDGACHVPTGPMLGAVRDMEFDGQPTSQADGDDANGNPDDEDGVTFGTLQVGQLGASVTVNVQNASGGAKLDAWIDFNGDGDWGGPWEQIAAGLAVSEGDNIVAFDVPSWAIDGITYARFRLSTAGNLGVGGEADDGEVEDYAVSIDPPVSTIGVFGGQNTISTAADAPWSVFAADVDGDGDMDVLSGSLYDGKIAWYENNGQQSFTPRTIATDAMGTRSVFAADADGDGDLDVFSASNDKIAWYENDGSPADGGWTAATLTTAAVSFWSVFAADVDGDGDLDVLSASQHDNKIAWYENDGNQGFTARTITTSADQAMSVFAADVDGDGDMDVLSASRQDDKIAWYENDGNENFASHTVGTADGAWSVYAADVDGDGDLDVLSASYADDRIAWYENDGTPADGGFTPHTISAVANMAVSVFASDVDGDGDQDVLSASWNDGTIAWYQNDGNQNFATRNIVSGNYGTVSVFAADMDDDGDLDVLSASYDDDKVAWYENLTLDFGDAPTSYPTTLAEDGARHDAVGPTIGANRDLESDGTHSAGADADDTAGVPDDEDGVSFGIVAAGQSGHAMLQVANASAGAMLDAWIDFDGDGIWEDPAERIATSQAVTNGGNDIVFSVPTSAAIGTTYARFRLSTAGGLGVSGPAADGEVEDHAVLITPAPDIIIGSVSLDGSAALSLTYQIAIGPGLPFEFGFFRSADNLFGVDDVLTGTVLINAPDDLSVGSHTKTFTIGSGADQIKLPGAGVTEVAGDYFLLAVADPQNQIDETAYPSGETNNTAVMTGVYHVAGGPVMVHGIATRDVIKLSPQAEPQSLKVDFNGAVFSYAPDDTTGVRIRGHNGSDEFQLRIDSGFGSPGTLAFFFHGGAATNTSKVWCSTSATKNAAAIYPMSANLVGPGYSLLLASMRGMTFTSQGGPDEAYIYDSSLDDTFTAYPTYVTLSNSLYTNRAEGFRYAYAYAQVGGAYKPAGGVDVARFYGRDGTKDFFRASAMYGIMADTETTRGTTYFVRGNWFEQVDAYGRTDGGRPSSVDRDQAMLFDAATSDLFEADTTTALATYAYSGASMVNAHTFRVVKGYGASGDTANLYGPGTYIPTPNPRMFTADYTAWANGFASLNWYPDGRPLSSSPRASAVDAALPLLFADDLGAPSIRKKTSLAAFDSALIALGEM